MKNFPILALAVSCLITALLVGLKYIPFTIIGFLLGYYLRDIFDHFSKK